MTSPSPFQPGSANAAEWLKGLARAVAEGTAVCQFCRGNCREAPCAYPSEGKPGCLRDAVYRAQLAAAHRW